MGKYLDEYEKQYIELGKQKGHILFGKLMTYILKKPNLMMQRRYLEKLIETTSEEDIVVMLRDFIPQNAQIERKFYQLADEMRFLKEEEVIQCITDLGSVPIGTEAFFKKVEMWQKNKQIYEILFEDNNPLIVVNTSCGVFPFVRVHEKYEEEIEKIQEEDRLLTEYYQLETILSFPLKKGNSETARPHFTGSGYDSMAGGNLDYKCHFASKEFVKMHPEASIITAECPNSFSGIFWLHSYNLDETGEWVIDLANQIIMPKDKFDELFKPNILLQTKGSELEAFCQQYQENDAFDSTPWLAEIAAFEKLQQIKSRQKKK